MSTRTNKMIAACRADHEFDGLCRLEMKMDGRDRLFLGPRPVKMGRESIS